MRKLLLPLALSMSVISFTATAAGQRSSYQNGRYAYSIAVPPGFSEVSEADNGDGGIATSTDGRAELRVWGNHILEGDLRQAVTEDMDGDRQAGWTISYQKKKAGWASWSGAKGGRIFYQRSIAGCDGDMASFRLEYDQSQLKDYDAVVSQLVKSLRSDC